MNDDDEHTLNATLVDIKKTASTEIIVGLCVVDASEFRKVANSRSRLGSNGHLWPWSAQQF